MIKLKKFLALLLSCIMVFTLFIGTVSALPAADTSDPLAHTVELSDDAGK